MQSVLQRTGRRREEEEEETEEKEREGERGKRGERKGSSPVGAESSRVDHSSMQREEHTKYTKRENEDLDISCEIVDERGHLPSTANGPTAIGAVQAVTS